MNTVTHNVDTSEIAKFSAMAEEWWNPYGKCKPLHDINPLRFEFIKRHIDLHDKRILDIGCGGGILTESLAEEGAKTIGIDLSEEALHVAQLHAKERELCINYILTSAEDFTKEQQASFDIITCMELLEHVPDPESLIHACTKLVKPGGQVFFSTINRNPKAFLYAILGAEYLLRLLPRGTHEYAKFLRPSELEQMARKVGLQLIDLQGITYHPIAKEYRLSHNVAVNYLACCIKL
jgi:2-polyprenyl-6-hydroxyphenyl methylase / 3-demethylubiquinone-9 3-methyltransferase